MTVREEKAVLRSEIRKRLENLPEEYKRKADEAICQRLLETDAYRRARTVFCFVGVGNEINTRPFLERVLADGKRLAVPLCTGPHRMEAHEVTRLSDLHPSRFGLLEPDVSAPLVWPSEIDWAVIPCLAATRAGNRLGHGGGYYDAYFTLHPGIPAVLVCREELICPEIPAEKTDCRFPFVLTEAAD